MNFYELHKFVIFQFFIVLNVTRITIYICTVHSFITNH